jgi:hypothetical protein
MYIWHTKISNKYNTTRKCLFSAAFGSHKVGKTATKLKIWPIYRQSWLATKFVAGNTYRQLSRPQNKGKFWHKIIGWFWTAAIFVGELKKKEKTWKEKLNHLRQSLFLSTFDFFNKFRKLHTNIILLKLDGT